jgi:threonine/homoserine/homoserine lactone efflux protein
MFSSKRQLKLELVVERAGSAYLLFFGVVKKRTSRKTEPKATSPKATNNNEFIIAPLRKYTTPREILQYHKLQREQ